ncbi:MAG: tRNA pseudouridine(13) synthase TruD [Gammaproteobacteria bacterium]|nr:tRNA pseudouridine(13) synthase TruD [Gammaproteobacteria bacterium]
MTIEILVWPYVYGSPSGSGKLRCVTDDFKVFENLAFEPSGEGEHAFLQIEKTGQNTEYVARQLARVAGVRQRDIGYAGLKDRHAVTTQWFSVWLPGKSDPDWSVLEQDGINVLQTTRHARKLKRGALSGNRFEITIRDWQGDNDQLIAQLTAINVNGIANYYGEQRFGFNGKNVANALSMFQGQKVRREQRSLYLSAARSYLFNQILAKRVSAGTWNKAIAGDTLLFDGSRSCFQSQQPDDDIIRRINTKTIHPSGVLWGKGELDIALDALCIEQEVINANAELAQGLIASGVELSRRALRVNAENLIWDFINPTTLFLSFTLPAGSYVTALVREIIAVDF